MRNLNHKFVYVRFGDIPQTGRSEIHCGDSGKIGEEEGVSVYNAILLTSPSDPDIEFVQLLVPRRPQYSTFTSMCALYGSDRPAYIVEGKLCGTGSDGEPLLCDPKIVREIELPRL